MSLILENIPPSNPPKKSAVKPKSKIKAKPIDLDYSDPDEYELDNEDFEQELINKQKNKMKIPRNNRGRLVYDDDEEEEEEEEDEEIITTKKKRNISSANKNRAVSQNKKKINKYNDDDEEEEMSRRARSVKNRNVTKKNETKPNVKKPNVIKPNVKKPNIKKSYVKKFSKTQPLSIKNNEGNKNKNNKNATIVNNGKKTKPYKPLIIDSEEEEEEEEEEEIKSKNNIKKNTNNTKKIIKNINDDEEEEEEEEEEIKPKNNIKKNTNDTKKIIKNINDDEMEEEEEEEEIIPKNNIKKNTNNTKQIIKNNVEDEEEEEEDYKPKNKNISKSNGINYPHYGNIDDSFEEKKVQIQKNDNKKKISEYNKIDNDSFEENRNRKQINKNYKKESDSNQISSKINSKYSKKDNKSNKTNNNKNINTTKKHGIFGIKNEKDAKKAKNILNDLFATKKYLKDSEDEDENIIPENNPTEEKEDLSKLLTKINTLDYQGYKYTIKDEDYFINNNIKYQTILNNEDAALKKCELIYNSIPEGQSFEDPEFGSSSTDGGRMNKKSLYGDGPIGSINPNQIEWYSIGEISEEAKFFDDGAESNDVCQGGLGDCWFISALSVLATKDYLLRGEFNSNILDDGIIDEEENTMLSTGVYPPIFQTFRRKGIFCFKFFKNFKWRYVIVDDKLPCCKVFQKNTPKKLIYGKCRSCNEFWVPLIEKAYAKIHGNYSALVSGFIDDGLVDLTGLTAKKVLINQEDRTNPNKIEALWNLLMENSTIDFGKHKYETKEGKKVTAKIYTRNKSMMGCSVDPAGKKVEMEVIIENQHTGVMCGHAYSILDCFEIPKPRSKKPRKTSRLLRIRNPWGCKEWNGKWCDDSDEVNANKERIESALNKKYEGTNEKISLSDEDGCFIMCFSDFRKIFNKLYICVNYPPEYIGIRYYGKWTSKETGGLPINNKPSEFQDFYKNPQYYFSMGKGSKVYITLLQEDGRLSGKKFPFGEIVKKVCLLLFRTRGKRRIDDFNNIIDKTLIVQRRDLSMEIELEKGEYVIIPSTLTKGEYANFCIEIYIEDTLQKGRKGEPFTFDRLTNFRMEKLGGEDAKYELIKDTLSEEAEGVRENKKEFIFAQFKNCLQNNDDTDYTYGRGSSGRSEDELGEFADEIY